MASIKYLNIIKTHQLYTSIQSTEVSSMGDPIWTRVCGGLTVFLKQLTFLELKVAGQPYGTISVYFGLNLCMICLQKTYFFHDGAQQQFQNFTIMSKYHLEDTNNTKIYVGLKRDGVWKKKIV